MRDRRLAIRRSRSIRYENDGRPDFAANPTNGRPLPTYDEANRCTATITTMRPDVSSVTSVNSRHCLSTSSCRARGRPRSASSGSSATRWPSKPTTCTARGGSRRTSSTTSTCSSIRPPAPTCNFKIRSNRPYPNWGVISMNTHTARSAYHGLITGFTKRFSNRWQASATYTLSGFWAAESRPFSGLYIVPFPTAPDLGGEWGLSEDDQRHRAVVQRHLAGGPRLPGERASIIWAPASGDASNYGGDLRNTGATFSGRLRPDGTIVPLQRRSLLRRRIGPICGCSSGSRCPAACRSMASWKSSTSSTGRTGPSAPRRASVRSILQHTNAQYRSAQVGFRLTF